MSKNVCVATLSFIDATRIVVRQLESFLSLPVDTHFSRCSRHLDCARGTDAEIKGETTNERTIPRIHYVVNGEIHGADVFF